MKPGTFGNVPIYAIDEAQKVSLTRTGLTFASVLLVALGGFVFGVPGAIAAAGLAAFGFPRLEKIILKAIGVEE